MIDKEDVNTVFRVLLVNQDQFLTARQLALKTGLPSRGQQVEVRDAIRILVEKEREPIISTEAGFKLTNNRQELLAYAHSLENREKEIRYRRECILAQLGIGLVTERPTGQCKDCGADVPIASGKVYCDLHEIMHRGVIHECHTRSAPQQVGVSALRTS